MKKNILIALIAGSTLLAGSTMLTGCCDDFLDRNPFGSIDNSTFFKDAEHANLAAIACYANLRSLNNHWALAQLELGMTGDLSSQGFKDAQAFYSGTFNPNDNNLVKGIWSRCYQGIAACNSNIEGVSSMPDKNITEKQRNQYLAEMRFIRAFWYFRLIQFYGDVPMRSATVNPTNAEEVQLSATPKEQLIADLIIPDLEFAAENLPESWDEKYALRATKGTAYAYLCEVNLFAKNYEEAINNGKKVESYGYELLEDPGRVLRIEEENSKEIVFSAGVGMGIGSWYRDFYWGTKEDLGEDGRIMRGDSYSGNYFYPSQEMVDFFQTIEGKKITDTPSNPAYFDKNQAWKYRDPRFEATFFTVEDEIVTTKGKKMNWQTDWLDNTATGYDVQKRGIWYGDDTWNMRSDIHFMRLPRVYLHMAEAYALKQNPDFGKCSEYVEKVRNRARQFALKNRDRYVPASMSDDQVLPPHVINSKESAMKAIDYESRVEFFAEDCIRYFDLKRWNTLKDEWSRVGDFTWDDKLFNLPYPTSELSANPNLKQNHPGWGN